MLDLIHSNIWEIIISFCDIKTISSTRLVNKEVKQNLDTVLHNKKTVFSVRKDDIFQTVEYFVHFFLGKHGKFVRRDPKVINEGEFDSDNMGGKWTSYYPNYIKEIYFNGNETIEIKIGTDSDEYCRKINGKTVFLSVYNSNTFNLMRYLVGDTFHTHKYYFNRHGILTRVVVSIFKNNILIDRSEYLC